jgi:hypothetical protein
MNIDISIPIMKRKKLIQRGIVCFAVGDFRYGKMAAALAASIKQYEQIPIAIMWHGNALKTLDEQEMKLFDQLIPLSDSHIYNKDGSFNPIKARLYFYDLTPFEETLCIDADNVWLNRKKPSEAFNELSHTPFTIQNAGHTLCDAKADQRYSVWADLKTAIDGYCIHGRKFYRTYGEWIYFKKSPEAKKLFSTAKKIFLAKPKAIVKPFIGQEITDELAFSIAMAQTEIYPHHDNYHPTTYYHINSRGLLRYAQPYELANKYYTISMGGATNPPYITRNYNLMVEVSYRNMGLQNPFIWKEKRKFLEERKLA